ncbi:catalase-domain-containing protein [Penicillium herquei]|nr:catalase-domain-containing protein [Penicillium herquei]
MRTSNQNGWRQSIFPYVDIFEAIERKEYPVWNVYGQIMDPSEAEMYRWIIFDMTKVWSHKEFPLRQIWKLTMNRNILNRRLSLHQRWSLVLRPQLILYSKLDYLLIQMQPLPSWGQLPATTH